MSRLDGHAGFLRDVATMSAAYVADCQIRVTEVRVFGRNGPNSYANTLVLTNGKDIGSVVAKILRKPSLLKHKIIVRVMTPDKSGFYNHIKMQVSNR